MKKINDQTHYEACQIYKDLLLEMADSWEKIGMVHAKAGDSTLAREYFQLANYFVSEAYSPIEDNTEITGDSDSSHLG